jgi:L-malate glycosyltransferase
LLLWRAVPATPVRLAVILTSFDRGGTERQMTELIRRIDPARFETHVVCFREQGPWLPRVRERAVSLTEFKLGSFLSPVIVSKLLRVARWLRDQRFAVVHACDMYANIFGLPAATLARVPVRVGSRRGIVSPTQPGLLHLQRVAYRMAHKIVANSDAAAAALRHEGVAPSKVVVIPNGIDLGEEPPPRRRDHPPVITTVANLRQGKGHDVLLHAAIEVTRAWPDAIFQFVGDGPLRASLEQQAASAGLGDHVRFLGHRDDVGDILTASDLFAFPSFMEAFPNGVMEAMASGLPVVATKVGGIPELVQHGRNGLLVPPGDSAALAGAILRMLGSPADADEYGRAARKTIAARYSFERMVTTFEALWEEELAAHTARNYELRTTN